MSFAIPQSQLRGLSIPKAELYGKPHVGAHYEGNGVKSHKADEGARCLVCHAQSQSVHHAPPLSVGREFALVTDNGIFVLKPSLFALCGSGTTGCHNGFHGGARFVPEWVWRSDEAACAWWSGELLARMEPHSPELYDYGFWSIHDKVYGFCIEVRGHEGGGPDAL